jgi:probable HAF family extracellular repeat protein
MKLIVISIAASSLVVALATAQSPTDGEERSRTSRYEVTDLGKVGGAPGQPYFIGKNGLVGGAAAVPHGRMHAVLWFTGLKIDIGTPGLGGAHSAAFGVNEQGQAVGKAETSVPNGEDFCGFNALGLLPTTTRCRPFLWQHGAMTRLPTLGGPNGVANSINSRGTVVGFAENTLPDPDPACPVFQFKPVVWENGHIQELSTFGDPDGVAAAINDRGQVVGASGTCAPFNANSGLYLVENHALLWENGMVTDLGNLGGTGGIAGNHACAINNKGQVVGHSELPNDTTFHGFLWTKETGMQDLRTLPEDVASLALGINDRGEVVGASLGADFSPRAVLWDKEAMLDLNMLIPGNSGLHLLFADSINSSGEIVGLAVTDTGEAHGFLATPRHGED